MKALVNLNLSELRWLESRMRLLRQDFLHYEGAIPLAFTEEEMVLGKVLFAFSEKYLVQKDGEEPSFLTWDVE